jgi:hypothetical protein
MGSCTDPIGVATEPRLVYLDVNDSGGWRRVTSFNLNDFEDGDLELHAQQLLEMSSNPRLKARIIIQGGLAMPLVTWDREDGWREWADVT